MKTAEILNSITKIIESFLDQRTFSVKVGDTLSGKKLIKAGVPQGSVLGPTLYNIYTHDFPLYEGTEVALFANDTALLASSRDQDLAAATLQHAVEKFEDSADDWRISVNAEKTQAILYSWKTGPKPESLQLYNRRIP